jgi:hypothetical protein
MNEIARNRYVGAEAALQAGRRFAVGKYEAGLSGGAGSARGWNYWGFSGSDDAECCVDDQLWLLR